ncbi:hypothetical protein C8F01DRAFT_1362365 [Mycena amicta]|nr:hypothetical protein C8F01DRAFT_1362365 [Mycena amicta]
MDIPCYYVPYATSYATSPAHAAFPIPTPPVLHPLCHPPLRWSSFLFPPHSPSALAKRQIRRPNRRRRALVREPGAFSGSVSAYRGGEDGHPHCEELLWETKTGGFGTGVADVGKTADIFSGISQLRGFGFTGVQSWHIRRHMSEHPVFGEGNTAQYTYASLRS